MPQYNLLRELRPDMDATIEDDLLKAGVPHALLSSLLAYVRHGRPVGGFLMAVLEGRLFEAATKADTPNRAALGDIARAIVWHFPAAAFGSPERVIRWSKAAAAQDPELL